MALGDGRRFALWAPVQRDAEALLHFCRRVVPQGAARNVYQRFEPSWHLKAQAVGQRQRTVKVYPAGLVNRCPN